MLKSCLFVCLFFFLKILLLATEVECTRAVFQLCPILCNHGLLPARLFCPWDSPGKNTGGGSHFLLLGIFPTQGLNLGLLMASGLFTV